MGTASTVGAFLSVVAFAAGLYLGVNLPFPWPMAWAVGLTMGVLFSAATSATAEYVDARKRYPVATFGTNITHDVYDDETVEDCFSCSGADHEGHRVEWSKDEVAFGLVTERHNGGISYYCSTCHSDDVEAGLRAGHEREFRQRYEGEEHYFDVLSELRELYIELEHDGDFWEFTGAVMDRVDEAEDVTDPREYVYAVVNYDDADDERDFWDRLADHTGEGREVLKERFEDRGWFAHVRSRDPFDTASDQTEQPEGERRDGGESSAAEEERGPEADPAGPPRCPECKEPYTGDAPVEDMITVICPHCDEVSYVSQLLPPADEGGEESADVEEAEEESRDALH